MAEESAPAVLDVSLFDKELRGVQYLSHAGLLKGGDAALTDLGVLKRINHAAFGAHSGDDFGDDVGKKIAGQQTNFRAKMAAKPFAQLVADDDVNKLVENYLQALVDYHRGVVTELDSKPVKMETAIFNRKHERAEAKAKKYQNELDYLQKNPAIIRDTISKYPQALQLEKYMPVGKLAVKTGMVDSDMAKAEDMVNDALANASAHSLTLLSKPFQGITKGELTSYESDPAKFKTQLEGLATRITDSTEALSKAQICADAASGLSRVQALETLLSAQLNAALGGQHSPEDLAATIAKAPALIADYQSAALSLAHSFLGEGPGKDDARMKTLRTQLEAMMQKNNIELLPPAQAETKAEQLAVASAQDLMQLSTSDAQIAPKLSLLLSQVSPPLAYKKLVPEPQLIDEHASGIMLAFKKCGQWVSGLMHGSHTERGEQEVAAAAASQGAAIS